MNAAYENLITRRSIRKYKPDMVERELIDQIVQAGLYAPQDMRSNPPRSSL